MKTCCNSGRLFYSGNDLNDVFSGTLLEELKMYGEGQWKLRWYSDSPRDGRSKDRNPVEERPCVQCLPGLFLGGKEAGAWRSSPIPI